MEAFADTAQFESWVLSTAGSTSLGQAVCVRACPRLWQNTELARIEIQ